MNDKGRISFSQSLTLLFILLKLANVVTWHWLWMFSPLIVKFIWTILEFLDDKVSYLRKKRDVEIRNKEWEAKLKEIEYKKEKERNGTGVK